MLQVLLSPSLTLIKIGIVLRVLREGEAVGDLQPVIHHQAQQHSLHHLTSLALLLVVFNDLQHYLQRQTASL